jgi:hypothetical protein
VPPVTHRSRCGLPLTATSLTWRNSGRGTGETTQTPTSRTTTWHPDGHVPALTWACAGQRPLPGPEGRARRHVTAASRCRSAPRLPQLGGGRDEPREERIEPRAQAGQRSPGSGWQRRGARPRTANSGTDDVNTYMIRRQPEPGYRWYVRDAGTGAVLGGSTTRWRAGSQLTSARPAARSKSGTAGAVSASRAALATPTGNRTQSPKPVRDGRRRCQRPARQASQPPAAKTGQLSRGRTARQAQRHTAARRRHPP